MRTKLIYLLVVCLLISIFGCAKPEQKTLLIGSLHGKIASGGLARIDSPLELRLGYVTDIRSIRFVGNVGGQFYVAEENVAVNVKKAVRRACALKGLVLSEDKLPELNVEVREWIFEVEGGFPKKLVRARAQIEWSLEDTRGRLVHSSRHRGFSQSSYLTLDEANLSEVLVMAMSSAITGAVKDLSFLRALTDNQ